MKGTDLVDVCMTTYPRRKIPVAFVTVYAADNYGNSPEQLTPDQARDVADELYRQAERVEAWTQKISSLRRTRLGAS